MKAFTVMLIEDNPDHAELVSECLLEGVPSTRVVHVNTGMRALEMISADAETGASLPDLILLDINMPGQSGHDILSILKTSATLRVIPVVMLSTSASPQDVERALLAHANGYAVKSGEYEVLNRDMQLLAKYWCHANARGSRTVAAT